LAARTEEREISRAARSDVSIVQLHRLSPAGLLFPPRKATLYS
jgi:hypothetical protein